MDDLALYSSYYTAHAQSIASNRSEQYFDVAISNLHCGVHPLYRVFPASSTCDGEQFDFGPYFCFSFVDYCACRQRPDAYHAR